MNCYNCDTELIWNNDYAIEEDTKESMKYSIVTYLSCPKCKCDVQIYYPKKEKND